MRVIKWEPFRDMDDIFNRFFADTLRRLQQERENRGKRHRARTPATVVPIGLHKRRIGQRSLL